MSRETHRQILIAKLNAHGIFETMNHRPLEELSYHALQTVADMELAVRA